MLHAEHTFKSFSALSTKRVVCHPPSAPKKQAELIAAPRESGFTDELLWPSSYCTNPSVIANDNNVAASIVAHQSSPSSANSCDKNLDHRQQLVEQDTRNRDGIEACVQLSRVSLAVWPKRCCAGDSKQLETCTEHRWEHLNVSELSEGPTTSTMQQPQHMDCTSNFYTCVFVCHLWRITLFSWCVPWPRAKSNTCK